MNTAELDFELPPELIAQEPTPERPASKLLHYRRDGKSIAHRQFSDLPSLLQPGDLLVFNNARVVPARFTLLKKSGGRIEGLFIRQTRPTHWQVLLKNLGNYGSAEVKFEKDPSITANVVQFNKHGEYEIEVSSIETALHILARIGRMPLPPYIKRDKHEDARDKFDEHRYQTVYAEASGSVAAPTAGLHFDHSVMSELDRKGIERAFLTLHVGLGTFKPVTAEKLEDHEMHVERYSIDEKCAHQINDAKKQHRRVIAVGTTACRVLESQAEGEIQPISSETGIFIYPRYEFKHVDGLITNFHLPKSTLIALVAALVGLDEQRKIYAEAIKEKYRFFSYGDSSFLE